MSLPFFIYICGMASKHEVDISQVIEMIIEGKTYRQMSDELNIPLSTLHDILSKPEHSARVKSALLISADTYVDMAEKAIVGAPKDMIEMQRARLLDQHYRWKASKRRPKDYGDRIDLTSDGEAMKHPQIIIKMNNDDSDSNDNS